MGSKGSQTQTSNQSQTYAPAGAGYVQNALQNAQNVVQNNPFQAPAAPVAGFSGLQQQGFNQVGNSANLANPFFQQAGQLYGQSAQQPNVSQFYNPMASAVGAQLQNIFGQQNSQNTGQLTQAAGGVGADRIAVGQANLANQQGLAAGQTYAGLWQQAQQAAQQQQQAQMAAASGLANTGAGMQNAALQGGNALLGAGGLQQNLAQQQLNSPYQQQLAQQAFPYQQASWLSGQVGALAPGLGGTTYGQGQTQSQFNPSLFGQIGGGLQALGGGLGYLSGNKGSSPSYGGGNMFSGDAYGGSGSNPLPGLSASDYGPGYAPGGAVNPFAAGGVPDTPIDIEPASMFPTGQLPHIQPHIPQLNLNPPQQGGGGGGGGGGGAGLGTLLQLASMFGSGGTVHANPYYADGGGVDLEDRFTPVKDAIAGGTFDPQGANYTNFGGSPSMAMAPGDVPMPQPRPSAADDEPEDVTATSKLPAVASPSLAPGAQADTGPSLAGFLKSPWSAVTLGGLEAMRSGSLASGFGKTLQLAQTQRDADLKEQEHQDSLTKMSPYQQAQIALKKQENENADEGVIDDATAQYYGKIYNATGQMPSLGFGKTAAKSRAKIAQFAMQEGKPEDAVANRVEFGANKAGAATAARQQAGIDRAVIEAQNTFPLAEQASEAVPRGKWVPINKLALAIKSGTSDPALAAFYVANQGAVNAYAAAMGRGNAVVSVHAQEHANELLQTATSHTAYVAALRQMQKEMVAARKAPAQVRQDIRNQITGGQGEGAPAGAAPSFTGRTASGPGGAKLRETSTGDWVQ